MLAPGGVAYISYNTLPGGRQRSMLRDMLLHHARSHTRPRERLAAAREMIQFLATPLETEPPGQDWLRAELLRLRDARDSYLYHEYLEETNDPLLFSDFVARAGAHGLQYLADTQLHTLFPSTLGAAAESSLARFDDLIDEEQYADFLRLRPFRQSLLCRTADPLTREIDLDHLFSLPLYTDLTPDAEGMLRNSAGKGFQADSPLLRAVLKELAQDFPRARFLAELLPAAMDRVTGNTGGADAETGPLMHELFNLFISGALQPTLCGPAVPGLNGDKPGAATAVHPKASRLARSLADAGEHLIPTPRHQALQLDPLSACILALLDGHRDHAGVVEGTRSATARDPALTRMLGNARPDRMRATIRASLAQLLRLLRRHGLLEAG
ncbi:methyltransferase regulatory domain-containing protein, partial [Thioalkalivibrio sp.]|uniref:methyltransferase regulatory domain-containing protein n=1 Tax=Thioalkalivibrio sp. TaxID=2093813 RepID=UPI00397516DE